MDNITFTERIRDLVKIKQAKNNWADMNPKITPIHQVKPCEDCGKMVKGRVVEIYIKRWSNDPVWTKNCSICKEKTPMGK